MRARSRELFHAGSQVYRFAVGVFFFRKHNATVRNFLLISNYIDSLFRRKVVMRAFIAILNPPVFLENTF
jgi:hypothetical protein